MLDLIIKNGTIVNATRLEKADVAVKDGKIVALGDARLFPEAKKVIDTTDKYVMPGMIDAHVHVNLKMGEFTTLDSFRSASIAAAYGGTTTMIEFAIPYNNETPLQAVERRINEAKGHSIIDYSFHGCVTKGNESAYQDVKDLLSGGITSIKMFTVYKDIVMIGMGEIYDVLKLIKQYGGIAMFHAESDDIINYLIAKYVFEGKTTPEYHALSRPGIAEVQAIASLLTLIEETKAPSMFVHVSTERSRNVLVDVKRRLPIFTEVCPHYLVLSEDKYKAKDGQKFICSPPLRSKRDQDGLWEMIRDGLVDVVNSDHCCYDTAQKDKYKNNFPKAPNGLPGIETRGTILFSEGVAKGRITIDQFVDLTSTRVAKLMGMYPRKGYIGVGSDADIVVLDKDKTYQISADSLHMQTDYTPFEGFQVTGQPVYTIVRGNILIENGRLVNPKFKGEFISRKGPVLD